MRLVLVLAATVVLAACTPVATPESSPSPVASSALAAGAVVTYAFHDSSVPPQYQRSVTLTVTEETSHIVIDSYGDVLADKTASTPPDVWGTLAATLPDVSGLPIDEQTEACAGGTGISLTVATDTETTVELDPQFCGGSNPGVEAAIDAWIAPARDLFPATDVLAPTG
jgi:hypothetical protein